MIRFGITDAAGLERPTTIFGAPRDIAIPVLWRALQQSAEPPKAAVADAFNRLKAGGGVYKRTVARRFDDVRAEVTAALREALGTPATLRVHDLGVSDGTTSVELHADLKACWADVSLVMSDAFDRIWVVRRPASPWTCVLDADLRPLQYYSRRFVLPADPPPSWRIPLNRLVRARVVKREGPRFLEIADLLRSGGESASLPPGVTAERILLVGRAAAALLAKDPGVTFVRHDATRPLSGRFHLVRAMNVLNRAYFDEATLRRAIGHVRDALEPGGVFLAGRSIDEQDGRTAATVFVRTGDRLEVRRRFNEGSELEALA
jgi:hypothetical protein